MGEFLPILTFFTLKKLKTFNEKNSNLGKFEEEGVSFLSFGLFLRKILIKNLDIYYVYRNKSFLIFIKKISQDKVININVNNICYIYFAHFE